MPPSRNVLVIFHSKEPSKKSRSQRPSRTDDPTIFPHPNHPFAGSYSRGGSRGPPSFQVFSLPRLKCHHQLRHTPLTAFGSDKHHQIEAQPNRKQQPVPGRSFPQSTQRTQHSLSRGPNATQQRLTITPSRETKHTTHSIRSFAPFSSSTQSLDFTLPSHNNALLPLSFIPPNDDHDPKRLNFAYPALSDLTDSPYRRRHALITRLRRQRRDVGRPRRRVA